MAPKISSETENFLPDYLAICNVSGCGHVEVCNFVYVDCLVENRIVQCATGNPVPVPVDPVIFFRSGSGQILTGSTGLG